MNQESNSRGMSLVKKGKRGIVAAVFSRAGLVILLLALQVLLLIGIFQRFEPYIPHIYSLSILLNSLIVLYLLNSSFDPTAKITWLIIILVFPAFGALLFLYTQQDIGHRALKARALQLIKETKHIIPQSQQTMEQLRHVSPGAAALANYVSRSGCYPIYQNTQVTYFPIGEDKFEALLKELEQAKQFIFLEYFIINEGVMWGQVLEILARKVQEGVDVRVMYDGTCEFSALPHNYPKRLKQLGIQCKAFAPITPFVSTHYNYRDHRKILVIDGKVGFTGGVNLADEYINRHERFGHWKDTAVMLKGEAVRSFTLMFLQMWSMEEKEPVFEPYIQVPEALNIHANGFVMPYGDCPLDSYKVGEQVYIDLLNRAERYVHIMTPYLILDGEMENAIKFAAERGVDVRIILPGIPDKKIPYALALTHYASLLSSGVKLYEYTPGFVHAKNFVVDDREAVVGTINLDYRSLYHHFECAAYMYGVDCISDVEQDFLDTQEKCRAVTVQSLAHASPARRITGYIMKVFAPLL